MFDLTLVLYWSMVVCIVGMVFVFGIVVGSFLNVVVARMPMEKSLVWPSSRCGNCCRPIAWYDNLPLVSYLWLRGRCRTCQTSYSSRYFFIELLTGLGFVGLFFLEVVVNVHDWPPKGFGGAWGMRFDIFYATRWVGFIYHAIFFSFLMAAAFCDLQGRFIPLGITLTGTLVGLIGSMLMPWPWPNVVRNLPDNDWSVAPGKHLLEQGVYPWPVWGPLPEWLPPGSWQLGLATGLAGLLAGTILMRGVSFLFSKGLGKEALGIGDADLMMMAGAFLGWQPVVMAFFISVFPGLFVGLYQILIRKDDSLPFGPSLGLGLLITFLSWHWIGPEVRQLFFFRELLIIFAILGGVFMLASSYFLRIMRSAKA